MQIQIIIIIYILTKVIFNIVIEYYYLLDLINNYILSSAFVLKKR